MIAASIGKKQIGKVLLGAVAVVVVAVGAVYFVGKGKNGDDGAAKIEGATAEQREAYLLSVGLQVDTTSSVAEVSVPKEFDERFAAYNEMLKATGFDLEGLKGETVKKCTYTVTNRSDIGASVSAVLLIYNDEIVAGHLIDNVVNKLYPLFDASGDTQTDAEATETVLPSDEEQETAKDTTGEEAAPEAGPKEKDDKETSSQVKTGEYPTE